VNRRSAGFTLLEIVVAMAIFGIFLLVIGILTSEMRSYEKRLPVNFMRHPQISAVVARVRRDVLDAHGSKPYRNSHGEYTMSPKTLILESVQATGGVETVVWDFSKPGEVRRISYNVGVASEWVARGVPEDFSSSVTLDAVDIPGRPYGVRLIAKDRNGRIAIDQILQPRAHE
jgi:prepilin-type N-terminal cleavage/methylation domain-containing protein